MSLKWNIEPAFLHAASPAPRQEFSHFYKQAGSSGVEEKNLHTLVAPLLFLQCAVTGY